MDIHCTPAVSHGKRSRLDAIFLLSDAEKNTYRCGCCETALDKKF